MKIGSRVRVKSLIEVDKKYNLKVGMVGTITQMNNIIVSVTLDNWEHNLEGKFLLKPNEWIFTPYQVEEINPSINEELE